MMYPRYAAEWKAAMIRKGKGNRPEVGAMRSFGEALASRLGRGTRPQGSPAAFGLPWTVKAFADAVGASERSVRDWRGGKRLPNDLVAIERELFGDNLAYRELREHLRRLYYQARQARGGVQSAAAALERTTNPMTPSEVPKTLEIIAQFVMTSPTDALVKFVRDLAPVWKERGGLVASTPRHSGRWGDASTRRP